MAIRDIRLEGDDVLRKRSREVKEITPRIEELIDDMFDTMYYEDGVGLAAVQVGVLRRVIVIDITEDKKKPLVLINPILIFREGLQVTDEGCLSVPDISSKVARPDHVTIEYMDREGRIRRLDAYGLLAKAIMHEMDHLEGILFPDLAIDEEDPEGEEKSKKKCEKVEASLYNPSMLSKENIEVEEFGISKDFIVAHSDISAPKRKEEALKWD